MKPYPLKIGGRIYKTVFFVFAIERIVDTSIGIIVALVVNMLPCKT